MNKTQIFEHKGYVGMTTNGNPETMFLFKDGKPSMNMNDVVTASPINTVEISSKAVEIFKLLPKSDNKSSVLTIASIPKDTKSTEKVEVFAWVGMDNFIFEEEDYSKVVLSKDFDISKIEVNPELKGSKSFIEFVEECITSKNLKVVKDEKEVKKQ